MQTLHMIPYADTYAAMLVSGYISEPVCRMLSMRTRMQITCLIVVKCGPISGVKCRYVTGSKIFMYVYGGVYMGQFTTK